MAKALNQNLHSQFRSIVDTLATTAVKEISKLVDDGFAILHLEISRSQKENEALKCKLQMMELQMARCYAEDSGLRERLAMCRCSGVQSDRYKILQIDSELQPGPENSRAPDVRAEVSYPDIISGAGRSVAGAFVPWTDMEEGSAELVLIKEEGVEEDTDTQGEMNSREKRSVDWRAASREKLPVQETQNKAPTLTEELTEQHRTRRAVWEVSGLDSALKTEPETARAESPQHTGYEQSAGRPHSSCPESLMCERTSRLRTLCTQGAGETEAGAPSCSYASESSCKSLSIHSGLQSLPPTGNTAACSLSLGSVAVKPEAVMIDSAAAEEEAEVLSTWSAEPISENIPAQRKHCSQERPFVCQQCGKRFIHLSHFTIHRRVHTGEKPYRCTVCQQQFSRSGSLNRHYRVHTGERPFRCTYCGKCFSESGNLRKHQQTHNRERPFRCTHCGRMFISVQILQKHQQRVHTALVL